VIQEKGSPLLLYGDSGIGNRGISGMGNIQGKTPNFGYPPISSGAKLGKNPRALLQLLILSLLPFITGESKTKDSRDIVKFLKES
jgi:hypothetical protein